MAKVLKLAYVGTNYHGLAWQVPRLGQGFGMGVS